MLDKYFKNIKNYVLGVVNKWFWLKNLFVMLLLEIFLSNFLLFYVFRVEKKTILKLISIQLGWEWTRYNNIQTYMN